MGQDRQALVTSPIASEAEPGGGLWPRVVSRCVVEEAGGLKGAGRPGQILRLQAEGVLAVFGRGRWAARQC